MIGHVPDVAERLAQVVRVAHRVYLRCACLAEALILIFDRFESVTRLLLPNDRVSDTRANATMSSLCFHMFFIVLVV